jgi:hypothetical protein
MQGLALYQRPPTSAPRRFTGGSESLAARTAQPTRRPLRPPPVYRWERKFDSEKAPPPIIKKKAVCPLVTPAPVNQQPSVYQQPLLVCS